MSVASSRRLSNAMARPADPKRHAEIDGIAREEVGEEAYLERKFGDVYRAVCRSVAEAGRPHDPPRRQRAAVESDRGT
jgi:hypothetical protein